MTKIHDDAIAISGELTELRRAIHREPEIGRDLPRTQAKVLAALDGLPLEIAAGRSLSSVTAVLRPRRGRSPPGRGPRSWTWRRLALDIASAHGLSATAEFADGYPVTVNGAAEAAFAEQTVAGLFGSERYLRLPDPITGSEDRAGCGASAWYTIPAPWKSRWIELSGG